MQITVNSTNIVTFGFSITLDVPNKSVIFDIAALTEFNGAGGTLIQGINFSLNDASGNPLIQGNLGDGTWNWTDPNILVPSTDANPDYAGESTYTVDLSAIWGDNFPVLFQTYRIQGAIKDENGIVYQTGALYQKVCQPKGLTDLGYIEGEFTIKADCPNGFLKVAEVTNIAYDGKEPSAMESTGTLYYPRGTIDPIEYTFVDQLPNFTNSIVYTGSYKVINTTNAVYEYPEAFNVVLQYYTDCETYQITCENQMLSIMCCLTDYQIEMNRFCTGAKAAQMKETFNQAGTILAYGLLLQAAGKDSSAQAAQIRKLLNCNCDRGAIKKVSADPVNPIVYSIVVNGIHGTSVTSSVVGNTKTFLVDSDVYVVGKKVPSDTAFSIETDTSVAGIVTYRLSFNYTVLSQTILNTIGDNETLLTLFNSLVWNSGTIDLSNLDGKCILDISAVNYFLSQKVPTVATTWKSVLIGATTYTAPANLLASDITAVEAWLNGLGVGDYTTSFSAGNGGYYINVLSIDNSYTPVSAIFSNTYGDTTTVFQKTSKNIIALLQALIDYVCGLTDGQMVLETGLNVCYIDYNSEVQTVTYPAGTSLGEYLSALSQALCYTAENAQNSPTNFQNDLGLNAETGYIEQGYPLTRDTQTSLETFLRQWVTSGGYNILKFYPNGNLDIGATFSGSQVFENWDLQSAIASITRYKEILYQGADYPITWSNGTLATMSEIGFTFKIGGVGPLPTFDYAAQRIALATGKVGGATVIGLILDQYNANVSGDDPITLPKVINLLVGGYMNLLNDPDTTNGREWVGIQIAPTFDEPDGHSITSRVTAIGIYYNPAYTSDVDVIIEHFIKSERGRVDLGNSDGKGYFNPQRCTTAERTALPGLYPTEFATGGPMVFDTDLNKHYGWDGTIWNAFY